MDFFSYLGKALEIKKPDGSPVILNPTNSTINVGSVTNLTSLNPQKAADIIKDGKSTSIPNTKTTAGTSSKNLPNVKPNSMEQFASVNILWTLACLKPEQYNNPASYRNSPKDLTNVVFSSAGRFDSQRVKTFYGSPEYYIDNFEMKCIISGGEKTGNSNAISFTFDIYEPYSMGLLLQSMQTAAVNAGYLSYLDNTPYVLRMDIQGFNELGQNVTSVKPKFFTLKLTSMKFNVTEGGSNYKVEAIPYNHQGFSDVFNTTYSDLKLYGDKGGLGNVVELLSTGKSSLAAVLNDNEKKLVQEKQIGIPDEYYIEFPERAGDLYSKAGNPPTTNKATVSPASVSQKSASAASTSPEDAKSKPVNPIGLASLGFDQSRGGTHPFKLEGDQRDPKTGLVIRNGVTIDPKIRAFQFGQSQSLTSIINAIVLSSDYAKDAIDPKNVTPQGYIKWFKLDVQIALLSYDPIIGDYAKKITFRIVPYYVHQSIFSNPSAAPIGYAELMKEVCKNYQYIYTGQNVDILKFDVNINNLFYTGGNPKSEDKAAQTSNQDQGGTAEKKLPSTKSPTGSSPAAQAAQLGRSRKKRDPRLLSSYKGGSNDKSVEQNVAENFQQAFISGSSADMVSIDLEILGDPYWLVDSGIGNYFSGAPSETSQISNDGTMNYESGNIYVYLSFNTPARINEATGLYDFSVAGKSSPFGGIYRVSLVTNTFQDGVWKQKLKCLRMPGPQGEEANNIANASVPSNISKDSAGATETGEKSPPKTSIIEDSNTQASIQQSNANPVSTANKSATPAGTTKTTSNQATPVTGYRYYRDLGK